MILPSKHSSWWRRLLSLSSEDFFKTSSRDLDQDQHKCLGHTSSRRFQDFLKTFPRRLQDIFKTCKDLFKTFSRRIIKLNCSCYETYCRDVYLQKDLSRSHLQEIYGQCTKFARITKVSQILVSHFTAPFSGRLRISHLEPG